MNIKFRQFQSILKMIAVEKNLTVTMISLQLKTRKNWKMNNRKCKIATVIRHLFSGWPRCGPTHIEKNGKNLYVRYMSKYIKYIFAKSCIFKIYFTYIIYIFIKIYLTYTWHIFKWRRNIFSWPKVVYVDYIFYFYGGMHPILHSNIFFNVKLFATIILWWNLLKCSLWYLLELSDPF